MLTDACNVEVNAYETYRDKNHAESNMTTQKQMNIKELGEFPGPYIRVRTKQ